MVMVMVMVTLFIHGKSFRKDYKEIKRKMDQGLENRAGKLSRNIFPPPPPPPTSGRLSCHFQSQGYDLNFKSLFRVRYCGIITS